MHATVWICRTDEDMFLSKCQKQAFKFMWQPMKNMTDKCMLENGPVRDEFGVHWQWLQCKKVEGKAEKTRICNPGFSALICASTTRGAAQCQRSIMTRGSQPVCSITNTNNRFQVTFYYPKLDGPNYFLHSDVWHANIHYATPIVFTRNHSGKLP